MIYQDKLQNYISTARVSFIVLVISITIGLIWFAFKSNEKPDSIKKWFSILLGAFAWSAFLSFGFLLVKITFDTICESLQEFVYPNVDKIQTVTDLITFTFIGVIIAYSLLDMFVKSFAPDFYQSSLLKLRKSFIYWVNLKLTKVFGKQIIVAEVALPMMITLSIVWTGIVNLYTYNVINMLAVLVVLKAWDEFCSDFEIKHIAFLDVLFNVFKKKTK